MYIKKFLLLTTLIIMANMNTLAQTPDEYSKNWKSVAGFEKKGLTKSALQEVQNIFKMATTSGNWVQQVKSAMYQMKYRNMIEEDNRENNIFYLDTLIAKAKAPAKNILQSMQAELFMNYLENNRYTFYNRTALVEEKSKDIRTWSLQKIHSTILSQYKLSLKNESILKTTSLKGIEAILQKGENTRNLRPTLYDLLAHRAAAYFMNDETGIIMPAYKFVLDDEKIFAPAPEFIKTTFVTKDSSSNYLNAIKLLQEILKFHLQDTNPDALLDADLLRLAFVNQHAVISGKDRLYENALLSIENKYPGNPAAARAMYLRAELYYSQGSNYDRLNNTASQYEIKRAKETCELAINRFPGTEGAISSQNLINRILMPSLNMETENVNTLGSPFRCFVKYKNIEKLHLRIIRTDRAQMKKIVQYGYNDNLNELTSLKALKSWNISLPNLQDHQVHATEIKIDALQPGIYIILASINPDFNQSQNIIARLITHVSNISYLSNNKEELYILDRETGFPLSNATVQLWQQKYDYNTRRNEELRLEKYTSNANGYIKLARSHDTYVSAVQVTYNNDELFLDDHIAGYYYNSYEKKPVKKTFIFTDRSIYRPGQLVYFKGIMVSTDSSGKKSEPAGRIKTTLTLYDANGQKVNSLDVTTSEYGSYNGSFRLPEGLLNGQFFIQDSLTNAFHYISVEEYKRPKFYVEVTKPSGSYRLLDNITVTGKAMAYAGNNIDAAKVLYRVIRKVQYPVWWGWGSYFRTGRPYYPQSNEEMEITNGETTTNVNGTFTVNFKAIPDESIDKKNQPVFYYEVHADITDINGETRSGSTTVAVAYQSIQLDISIADKIEADSIRNVKIKSTNMNGIFEKTSVTVSLQKLISPKKIFRERYWETPDMFNISKAEYYQLFPNDVYSDENQLNKWEPGDKLIDKTDSSNENGSWNITNGQLQTGWYKITAVAKDKYGEQVRAEKFIQVTDGRGQTAENLDKISISAIKENAEPGEKVPYSISTGYDKLWLIHGTARMNNRLNTSYITLNPSSAYNNELSISETDRGGISLNVAFVKHNRAYNHTNNLLIPWSNKDLILQYETFRNKMLPGSDEQWKLNIRGHKGDAIAAETLISMYDASLDQFKQHNWNSLKSLWPVFTDYLNWKNGGFTATQSDEYEKISFEDKQHTAKSYDELYHNGWNDLYTYRRDRFALADNAAMAMPQAENAQEITVAGVKKALAGKVAGVAVSDKNEEPVSDSIRTINPNLPSPAGISGNNNIQVRKNFNETAFFFPALSTDSSGNTSFTFTMPEALTTWKIMALSHTRELASGYLEKTVVTQKPMMLQTNAPRFVRAGDQLEFSAKLVNLEEKEITGTVQLELFDVLENKPVDGWFKNIFPVQYFTVAGGQSSKIKFPISIPENYSSAITWRIKAITKNNEFSDGEESMLPVLTNRILVTESMPLNLRAVSNKDFRFEKLISSATSETLSQHAVTVEFSSNPAWYAVQALPYLMEYPYDCAEQNFNRYYANALASFISNANPAIKKVFDTWKQTDTAALLSNLEKNEELKSLLLQETPWILDAGNESQQKKNIALLFDLARMAREKETAFTKLKEMQSSNGGFSWFKGGPDDRYITQYILTGIGHLKKLGALNDDDYQKLLPIINKALPYLDARLKDEYDNLVRYKVNLKSNNLSATAIQYLYMRSFFTGTTISRSAQKAYTYYRNQSVKYWLSNSKYMQAMIALALYRTEDAGTAKAIIRSLKENAIYKEEMGMYWKELSQGGYYWYQAPIESQAMMIEAFSEIDRNVQVVDDLKTWLLKQKQVQNWKTTKATAEACYALVLNGTNWLAIEKEVHIKLGHVSVNSKEQQTEAGTGYFSKKFTAEQVVPEMGNISVHINPVSKNSIESATSWGAVYWQYFENLDKISASETPLKLSKKLFIEKNSDRGPVLQELKEGETLHTGDKIKVRIELRADRDMEYIHMKDMRASCMEPVNVLSQYKWQGGLGYYESTKDASTNFFFSRIARGTYVFEYPMFVTHNGNFSNGITTIQCMYAPEFTSHSQGIRVSVE